VEIDDYFYFPSIIAEADHIESVPLRVFSQAAAEEVSLVCNDDRLECSIAPEEQRLKLKFGSIPEGPFSAVVQSVYQGEVFARTTIEARAAKAKKETE